MTATLRWHPRPALMEDDMKNADKTALINELREYDHCFINPEGVKRFTEPFGFVGTTYTEKANTGAPKGLYTDDERTEMEGQDAAEVAAQICQNLGLGVPPLMGRGFKLRACCDILEKHLKDEDHEPVD